MLPDSLRLLRFRQSGVLSVAQLHEHGVTGQDIRRLVRRRVLVRIRPRVYVDHTGPLSRRQREWAEVLTRWPAALAAQSALPRPRDTGPIHVAVDATRRVEQKAGVRLWRKTGLRDLVDWNAAPPRMRPVDAALDAAGRERAPDRMYEVLADCVRSREVSAASLLARLEERPRLRRRRLIRLLLGDLGAGAESWLERRWLELERDHALPRGERQVHGTAGSARVRRDVRYGAFGVIVELDGWVHVSSTGARDRDSARDLATAVESRHVTVRLTYGLAFGRGCWAARQVGELLRQRGWEGGVHRCPACR